MNNEHLIKHAVQTVMNRLNHDQLDTFARQTIVEAIVAAIAEYDKQRLQEQP